MIGGGKACVSMAKTIADVPGDRLNEDVVIVKYGQSLPLKTIRIVEASHPIPDANGSEGSLQKSSVFCLRQVKKI